MTAAAVARSAMAAWQAWVLQAPSAVTMPMGWPPGIRSSRSGSMGASQTRLPVISMARTSRPTTRHRLRPSRPSPARSNRWRSPARCRSAGAAPHGAAPHHLANRLDSRGESFNPIAQQSRPARRAVREKYATTVTDKNVQYQCVGLWRRRRDSNPRGGFPPAPLAGACLRPLGHISACPFNGST